jgi:hypothetical protein
MLRGRSRWKPTVLLFEKMLRNMKKLAEGGTLTPEDKQAPVEF